MRACRSTGLFLFAFSFCINLLMLASPLYMMQLYDRVVSSRSLDTLFVLTLIFAFAIVTVSVLDGLRAQVLSRLGVWLDDRLGPPAIRAGLRAALMGGPVRAGEAMRDLATLRSFLGGPTVAPLIDAPWAPLFLTMLFILHPALGIIGLVATLILFGFAVLNELVTKTPLQNANVATGRGMRALDAAFRNAEVIEAMGMLDAIVDMWRVQSGAGKRAQRVANQRAAMVQSSTRFVRLFVQSAVMGAGAWLVIDGLATPSVMFASSFLIARTLAPVDNAIGTWKAFIAARMSYHRLHMLLDKAAPPSKGMEMPRPDGFLTAERVVFAPPGVPEPILRGVSFALQPAEVMGLIGPTASGKTTLARLIVGAWMPSSGHVRLDGADIAIWLASSGATHIGYLPQDVELFAGSVRDNIARLADAPAEAVIAAAKLAGLHEIIMRLPGGYDTDIGEGGMKLSGGLRQRIALARAVFGEPRLVVLDEPNSSLDTEGEAALVEAVAQLKSRGATVVVIAHRPSILQHADKLLVLRNGMVEHFGSRAEVIAKLNAAAVIGPSRTAIGGDQQRQPA